VTAHQLLGPHVVQYPLGVLAVMATLHDGEKKLGGVILRRDESTDDRANGNYLGIQNCKYSYYVICVEGT